MSVFSCRRALLYVSPPPAFHFLCQVAALSELRRFKDSPYDDTLARGEYFDVIYRGLCGAHIAAAVVARGGIVADSKDGWLRKVRSRLPSLP